METVMTTSTHLPDQLLVGEIEFDSIYEQANGDRSQVPWEDGQASPSLVNWLNNVAPSLVRCGARVMVVGCGLGDDARALIHRGYEVTAFDFSQTAIKWARAIDPENAHLYHHADLFDLPTRWKRRFDLVVEINTLQALPITKRSAVMTSLADLLSPHGNLLVISRGRDDDAPHGDGPPWPLSREDLHQAASSANLIVNGEFSEFLDDDQPPMQRLRGVFRRA